MKAPFQVFLLGTPGCGKSEVYRRLADRLVGEGLARDVMRIDDYPKVRACFEADDEGERAGRPRAYSSRGADGGWVITNAALWDDVLKRVNDDVRRERQPGRAIFLELPRRVAPPGHPLPRGGQPPRRRGLPPVRDRGDRGSPQEELMEPG